MNEKQQTQLLNSKYFEIKTISEKMKQSMERKELRQILKYSEAIISQLKTEFISTQHYYQLFTFIFDEILQIQSYFRVEIKQGRNILEFYKSVQQCITVLPRVYLMIIVGSLILETKKADTKEVLEDLIEACNGVKHPIRGLFVRYFLLKILKDYLIDIDLLMTNFKEMNKLWIRTNKIEYLNKNGIIKIRNDIKVLLGENIMRLALVLNNMNDKDKKINKDKIFKDKILLPFVNIIKESKDDLCQEYILICLIQVFKEEYIINNIDIILDLLSELKGNIDIKTILTDLMEKLSKYKEIEKLKNIKMRNIFKKINICIDAIINNYLTKINNILQEKEKEKEKQNKKENTDTDSTQKENNNITNSYNIIDINDKELINLIELQSSFLKFIIHFGKPEDKNEILNIANKTLDKCVELFSSVKNINKYNPNISMSNINLIPENMKILYNLLLLLIDSPLFIFQFKNFPTLMNYLSTIFKYELSIKILNNLINTYNLGTINNKEKLKNLISFIEPMIQINQTELNEYLLDKSINKISKLVFVPASKDPYEQLEMLQMIKNILINSTKNNTEYLSEKKKIIYLSNYLNYLCLLGLNISEAYDNLINNKKNKEKKPQIHIDFCNNFNFDNKKFNIRKEETFFPFYKLLFKEINSIFDIIKQISLELTIKLYIQCSQMVNGLKFDDIDKYEDYAYEYINNAILILKNKKKEKEKEIKDKKSDNKKDNKKDNNINEDIEIVEDNKKFNYLVDIIGAVSKMDIFTDEHFSSICSDIEQLSDGLMKRKEQCLITLKCLNLYCNDVEEDTNKIVELFSKAKKYAVYSMTNPENTILFVYILNEYLRIDGIIKDFDKIVKINDVEEIIETINNYLANMKNENKEPEMIKKIEDYYNNTIEFIKKRKEEKNQKMYKLISTLKIDKYLK